MKTILLAILLFGLLILLHEVGHFLTARLFGVTVREFAIGMGPKLFSHVSKKTGTAYSLRALPIGGYVSMEGEDESSEDEGAFCNKPVWQKMIIVAAGALMNLITGLILMVMMVLASETLGGTTVVRFRSEDASTLQSGLAIGDKILEVDGVRVHTSGDLVYEIMRSATQPVDLLVERDGQEVLLRDVKFPTEESDGITVGTVDFYVMGVKKTLGEVIRQSFYQSGSAIKMLWQSLFDLVRGKYGMDAVSGPVGVTGSIGEAASQGPRTLLYLCALIALNLGMVNMLPLPALDGGRFFFLLLELLRGKPINKEVEGKIHFVGIVLLMLLMLVITVKDIVKLL